MGRNESEISIQGYEIEISSERAFMVDLRALNMLSRNTYL